MNAEEFNEFRAKLGRVFPSLSTWFQALDGLSEGGAPVKATAIREAMRQRWRDCLAGTALTDALSAIDGLAREASDPWPWPADKERAAAIIAARARGIADERYRADELRQIAANGPGFARGASRRTESTPLTIGRISERLRGKIGDCRAEHPDADERQIVRMAAARLVEELDRTDPIEPDGARYECCICRDDGRVSVLLPEYVAGVAAEVIDPWLDVQTADCRCVCRRGMGGPSEAGAGAELLRDAVIVEMRFYRVRPKSHYRSGKNSHLLKPGAPPVPTHKPDVLKAMPATRKGSGGQRMLFATKGGA